ncbi:MAG: hypothetical protein QM608_00095 [Caulobacter sp.]
MTTAETLRSPAASRAFLIGPLILAGLIGLVALVPAPWPVRLAAAALALLTAWIALFFALPGPWLAMDDEGFTVRRRLGRPRRVSWSEIEAFEIGRTRPPATIWRMLAFIPWLILAAATSGYVDAGITDTSRAAIGWRRRGEAEPRRNDWIIDAYGLTQEALLERLRARLPGR